MAASSYLYPLCCACAGHVAGKAVPSPSITLMCIRPWTWSFLFWQPPGHSTWRAIFNVLYLEKCEVVQRGLAVKRVRLKNVFACDREDVYVQAWFITSTFLCNFSTSGCEHVLIYRVYGLCACGITSNGPSTDVSCAAHSWKSSSRSRSRAFWSQNHLHWIYKVQLKLGSIQSHAWGERGSYRSCWNWSDNYKGQVEKGSSAAPCMHQRGWGSGAGRHTGAPLCSPSFYKLQWLFFHIPFCKTTGSQKSASKSVERLLMTCLGSRACFIRMASIWILPLDCVSRQTCLA